MDTQKRRRFMRLFGSLTAICLFILLICNASNADIYTQQELLGTDWRSLDTFIWQDFEYWHAPRNYGWKSSCPPYPVFSY